MPGLRLPTVCRSSSEMRGNLGHQIYFICYCLANSLSVLIWVLVLQSSLPIPSRHKMSNLDVSNLFSVKDMVFVITGGGSGTLSSLHNNLLLRIDSTHRDRRNVRQSPRHQPRRKSVHPRAPHRSTRIHRLRLPRHHHPDPMRHHLKRLARGRRRARRERVLLRELRDCQFGRARADDVRLTQGS